MQEKWVGGPIAQMGQLESSQWRWRESLSMVPSTLLQTWPSVLTQGSLLPATPAFFLPSSSCSLGFSYGK